MAGTQARGLRNANPGNIRKTSQAWIGQSLEQNDPDFVQFSTPFYGLRALAVLLLNYQRRHGLWTIRQIISRYAPANENQTEAYVRSVSAFSGLFPGETADLSNSMTLKKVMQAVTIHENGYNPYSDTLFLDAIRDAQAN